MDQAYTKYFDGTSAAAPVVAGALALMLSVNPSMTAPEAISCMKKAASAPDAECSHGEKSVCFGAGIVDAGKMIELASSGEYGGEPVEFEDDEETPDETVDESVEEHENDVETESPDSNGNTETPDVEKRVDEEERSDSSATDDKPDNANVPEDESTGCLVLTI
jgi:subtilisin family serine protease